MEQQQNSQQREVVNGSWEDYYKMGKQLTTLGDYENGKKMFEQCLQRGGDNSEQVYVKYGHLLMLMKETEQAKLMLSKAITMNDSGKNEYNKYLELAQISFGVESLQLYEQGIKIIEQEIERTEGLNILEGENKDIRVLRNDLCDCYGAIAELYMSDLEGEENAQGICYQVILKGLGIDQQNIDCNFQLARYQLRIGEEEKAREGIRRVIEGIVKGEEKIEEEREELGIEFLIKVGQVGIEVEEFEQVVKILRIVVDRDVKDPEGLYLMAFTQFKIGNWENAGEMLEELAKVECNDEEILVAAKELKQEVDNKLETVMGDEENQQMQQNKNEEDEEDDDNEWMDIE